MTSRHHYLLKAPRSLVVCTWTPKDFGTVRVPSTYIHISVCTYTYIHTYVHIVIHKYRETTAKWSLWHDRQGRAAYRKQEHRTRSCLDFGFQGSAFMSTADSFKSPPKGSLPSDQQGLVGPAPDRPRIAPNIFFFFGSW